MNKSRFKNVVVGITAIIGLVCLSIMLMLFGALPGFLEPSYVVRLDMDQTGGITNGSRVRMNGLDIGDIRNIRMVDPKNPAQGITAEAHIRVEFSIPAEATAAVDAGGLLGGSPAVVIQVNHLKTERVATGYLPDDGSARLAVRSDGSLIEVIADRFEKLLVPALEKLDRVAVQFEELSDSWKTVGNQVAELTEKRDLAEVDQGRIEGNLHTMLVRADQRLA